MEMMREEKEVAFQGGTYSLKTINIQQKYFLGKINLYFPNKMHAN